MTYCRSNSQLLGIDDDLFQKRDIHLHFPAGAIPKDGPSAGITIATAIISLFTERKVSAKVAMTGEITLKGRVLPVGGLKEKLLGAKRAGIKTIIVPQRNYKNIMEIPEDIRKGMTIHYVDHLDEVLALAFVGQGPQPQAKSTAKRSKPGSGKAAGDKQRPRSGSTPPRERPFLY